MEDVLFYTHGVKPSTETLKPKKPGVSTVCLLFQREKSPREDFLEPGYFSK